MGIARARADTSRQHDGEVLADRGAGAGFLGGHRRADLSVSLSRPFPPPSTPLIRSTPPRSPTFIHEYRLSEYSLYAAMSVGLETQDIIEVLGRLSKTPLPQSLIRDIQRWTASYGKLKLVLKRSRYYLESAVPSIIQKLLADEVIASCRAVRVPGDENAAERALAVARGGVESGPKPSRDGLIIPGTKEARRAARLAKGLDPDEDEAEGEPAGNAGAERDGADDDILGAVIGLDRGQSLPRARFSGE